MNQRLPYSLLGLLILSSLYATGQARLASLQRVNITDKKVEGYLRYLVSKTKSDFIELKVDIDSTDNGYTCRASNIRYYESVETFRSTTWGKWENQIILLYGSTDLTKICQIVDTTDLTSLQKYARERLPNAIVTLSGSKTQELRYSPTGFLHMQFKLVKGRELYYYDSSGYDTRSNIPDKLPPAPEIDKKL